MNYTLVAEMIDDCFYTIGRYEDKSKAMLAFESMKDILVNQNTLSDIYGLTLRTEKGLIIKKHEAYGLQNLGV